MCVRVCVCVLGKDRLRLAHTQWWAGLGKLHLMWIISLLSLLFSSFLFWKCIFCGWVQKEIAHFFLGFRISLLWAPSLAAKHIKTLEKTNIVFSTSWEQVIVWHDSKGLFYFFQIFRSSQKEMRNRSFSYLAAFEVPGVSCQRFLRALKMENKTLSHHFKDADCTKWSFLLNWNYKLHDFLAFSN